MAKALNLILGGSTFALAPTKVERKKLYGWTELRATDPDGNVCRQAGLDSNGVTIIPKGATKIGMLREDGNWMEKDELQALHADGSVAEAIPSSFEGEIKLEQKVDTEKLMDCIVTSVYQLEGEGAEELAKAIGNDIYTFPFSYRGGYDASDGFLLSNGTTPFIFVGTEALFEMIGLEEQAVVDEPDDEVEMEEDELDFSMF
ncbi:MAG: hypothetical protein MJZ35_08625 [Bacteroidaceae bacterium]|nr:hypothetical protein [Bacteroidaceae bacterium]